MSEVDPQTLSDAHPDPGDPFADRVQVFGHSVSPVSVGTQALFMATLGGGIGWMMHSRSSPRPWLQPLIGALIGAAVGMGLEVGNARGPQVGTMRGNYSSRSSYGYRTGYVTSGPMRLETKPLGTAAATIGDAIGANAAILGPNIAFVRRGDQIERHRVTTDGMWNSITEWRPNDPSIVAFTQPDGKLDVGPGASPREQYVIGRAAAPAAPAKPVTPPIDWKSWLDSL